MRFVPPASGGRRDCHEPHRSGPTTSMPAVHAAPHDAAARRRAFRHPAVTCAAVNPQAAGELVHLWVVAHDDPDAVMAQRGPVSRAVRELAPDTELVAVGQTARGPAMVVLLESAMIVLQARPVGTATDVATPVRARLVQIAPAGLELEVTEHFEEGAEGLTRVHTWTLRTSSLELRFTGLEALHAGVEAGPDATEALCRTIATRLGWTLP